MTSKFRVVLVEVVEQGLKADKTTREFLAVSWALLLLTMCLEGSQLSIRTDHEML